MTIASLAQRARQSLARGLEALQARDAPQGLLDVAEPVAYAISGLVDLELDPGPVTAVSVTPVMDALRESLRLLQSPEFAEHPAAARSMKAIAEALSTVVTLTRYIRGGSLIAGPFSMSAPAASVRASVPYEGMLSATPQLAPLRTNAPMESTLSMLGPAPVVRNAMPPESTLLGAGPVVALRSSVPPEGAAAPAQSVAAPAFAAAAPMQSVIAPAQSVAAPAFSVAAPVQSVVAPAQSVTAPAFAAAAPVQSVVAPPSSVIAPAPSVAVPAFSQAAPAPSLAAPSPAVVAPAPSIAALAASVAAPAQAVAAAPPSGAAPAPSASVASMRPSVRALSAPANGSEPAVITRTLNAVHAAAAPEATLRADVTMSLLSAAVPSGRVEPTHARSEPSIVAREAPRATPEPPPLISSRPPQGAEARAPAPSRAPVSIRRDVVIERDLRAVDAPLGAHSPSNFYTGLAGGDVVASGGLFVATYQVPKIGEKVLLKISMPGGYEFVAKAKVAWTRDGQATLGPGSGRGVISAPGFGAQFCEITDEGRRLIQRYVRNREPLFHEDSA